MDSSKPQEQRIDIYPIALAKFLQVAPELGANILSYKDISEEMPQANDINVGVFILRTGLELFYVPVISKAENVYPIDSVFQASKGRFFPLTKKMVNTILTASKMTQGKPAKIPSSVNKNPDLTTLVTPPRTGKHVYASASRLEDFLAAMPAYLKDFTLTKVAEEKSVYEELHKLFSIRDIFAALQPPAKSMAAATNAAPISVVTGPVNNLTAEEIADILDNGYHVSGAQTGTRVAISATDYNKGKFSEIQNLDGNSDHELVFSNGQTREAFIPKILDLGINADTSSIALFTNGDFALGRSFVSVGDSLDRRNVLDTLFTSSPPVLPKDVNTDDVFTIMDTDANVVGVFRAHRVTLSNLGVEIGVSTLAGTHHRISNIIASRNYGAKPSIIGNSIYLPFSSLVLKLGSNISGELERTINAASKRHEISQAGMLGDQLNIGYDEVEFSINNKIVGSEANLMHRLAVTEGIEPGLAGSFIKQAKARRHVKIYLSKKASESAPSDPDSLNASQKPPVVPKAGLNGSFMPNVQGSLKLGDAQSTEATIISELLQAPDMYELIEEYLPEIEECIDKLGRILFLSRVNINQLAEGNDVDSVFAFLANLKSTYRMLGDNYIKLNEMLAIKPDASKS